MDLAESLAVLAHVLVDRALDHPLATSVELLTSNPAINGLILSRPAFDDFPSSGTIGSILSSSEWCLLERVLASFDIITTRLMDNGPRNYSAEYEALMRTIMLILLADPQWCSAILVYQKVYKSNSRAQVFLLARTAARVALNSAKGKQTLEECRPELKRLCEEAIVDHSGPNKFWELKVQLSSTRFISISRATSEESSKELMDWLLSEGAFIAPNDDYLSVC